MSRYLNHVGLWLLVAALVWYVSGCFIGDHLSQKKLAQAKALHQTNHRFDASAISSVAIRGFDTNDAGSRFNTIKLFFDPAGTQATVKNENLGVVVKGQVIGSSLDITLEKVASRQKKYYEDIVVHLPSSLHKVEFAGVSSVEVSGSFSHPMADLNLVLLDHKQMVTVKHIKADRLSLTATYLPGSNRSNSGFKILQPTVIHELDVQLAGGTLEFGSETTPERVRLDLGDAATVTAPRAFLQIAQFSKLP